MPGDIGSTSRYFDVDVTMPPYTAERGKVTLNRAGYEFGLGCSLCPEALSSVQTDRIVPVPLKEVAGRLKTVPVDGELVRAARELGLCMGD